MTEQEITDGWHEANMARIVGDMERDGVTLDELTAYWHNRCMVNIAGTQTPHLPSGNTVAGQ
jgi:hypothetical protein